MHASFLIAALAASASFVSVNGLAVPEKRYNSLVDLEARAAAPVLNNVQVGDFEKRDVLVNGADALNIMQKRSDELSARDLDLGLGIDATGRIKELLDNTIKNLQPILDTIEDALANFGTLPPGELTNILRGAFTAIHNLLAGLGGQVKQVGGPSLWRTKVGLKGKQERSIHGIEQRSPSKDEVTQALATLFERVAGIINKVEDLGDKVPGLGNALEPIFRLIDGDVVTILGLVRNILAGVLGFVKDLLSDLFGSIKLPEGRL